MTKHLTKKCKSCGLRFFNHNFDECKTVSKNISNEKETNMNNEEKKCECEDSKTTGRCPCDVCHGNRFIRHPLAVYNKEWTSCPKCQPLSSQPQVSNEWEESFKKEWEATGLGDIEIGDINIFDFFRSFISQVESKAIERTKGEFRKIIGEQIVQPESTFKMNPVDEFIWHENNGRNSEKTRILQALSSNKK